ncbi:MAG: isopenicillin N synthase family dioxygenase, partial [Planctomycetota bacterium JB042]
RPLRARAPVGRPDVEDLLPVADVLRQLADAFFALPPAEKGAIERTAENPWGYYDRELTKNVRDWKEIFDVGPADGGARPQWPASPPGFRPAMEAWFEACSTLARSLVGAIATNLGATPETLTACFDDATSFLRLNHYPPCDDPAPADSPTVPTAGRLGIGHHTDAGAVTVLLQDERPGLQVERDGTWHLVPPVADALTVNLGDVVQVWSNDRYRAPSHRVLADRERPRTSAPFFLNPSSSTTYAPLEGACRDAPPRYRPISWREFRAARAAGDYADVGEEIQISHFRR